MSSVNLLSVAIMYLITYYLIRIRPSIFGCFGGGAGVSPGSAPGGVERPPPQMGLSLPGITGRGEDGSRASGMIFILTSVLISMNGFALIQLIETRCSPWHIAAKAA